MSKRYKYDVPSWRTYRGKRGAYDDDDRGGNDEYYTKYCGACDERTEHDVCTGKCVNC